jgi:polysaccharide deacetylase family sporulation protein PdaB
VVNSRKRVLLCCALVLLLLACILFLFLPQNVVGVITRQGRLVPIYYVDTPEKKIAISFDASWGAEHTPSILKLLRDNQIKTTFFLTGFWIEKYPELVKEIVAEGHELGNHTFTHPHLNSLDKTGIKNELERVHAALKDLTGQDPVLFRPPFGEYSNKVIETADELGYYTIQWSVDSLDWKDLSEQAIITRVTTGLHPGAIVLFHNNGSYTAAALPEIFSYAKQEGYEIVPISQLLYKDNFYIDNSNGAQKKRN